VDELLQKGYVSLKADPADGRASLVYMSPKGNDFLRRAIEYTKQVETSWQAVVGKQEFKVMKQAMSTLLKTLWRKGGFKKIQNSYFFLLGVFIAVEAKGNAIGANIYNWRPVADSVFSPLKLSNKEL